MKKANSSEEIGLHQVPSKKRARSHSWNMKKMLKNVFPERVTITENRHTAEPTMEMDKENDKEERKEKPLYRTVSDTLLQRKGLLQREHFYVEKNIGDGFTWTQLWIERCGDVCGKGATKKSDDDGKTDIFSWGVERDSNTCSSCNTSVWNQPKQPLWSRFLNLFKCCVNKDPSQDFCDISTVYGNEILEKDLPHEFVTPKSLIFKPVLPRSASTYW